MNKEIIKKIIEAANTAPSGGNSQPWRFEVRGDIIECIALPEKDHKILNYRNRGTYIAHGALIENITIAARACGYEPNFKLFPSSNITASVSFTLLSEKKGSGLHDFIFKRHSNRKSFKTDPLSLEEKNYIFCDLNNFSECELFVIEGEGISNVAESLSFDTVISLQNQTLHRLLFQEIIWRKKEQKQKPGLYVKTMEMGFLKAFVFNLFSHWRIAKFFNKFKITKKIQRENIKTMSCSGLFGFIIVKNNDIDFLHAGRLMENIWLRASKLNLGFQLITGLVFYWQQVNFGNKKIFSLEERILINKSYKNLSNMLNIDNKIIALTFRIGKADKPLAVSYKRPPEIEWN